MTKHPPAGQLLIYQTEDGRLKVEARLEHETLWLTQQQMADLFQTSQQNISLHVQNVYEEGELRQEATHKDFLLVRQEGARQVSRQVAHYNLDVILSVGYRVKSAVATRFRIWATQTLREYIVKGFVLDDERLKNPDQPFDYFDELLRRIQDIRTSERRFYQKITDIYAASIDYDPTQPQSNLVEQYLVFAEGQAMRRVPMTMNDWISKLHGSLTINDRDILNRAGKISHDMAKAFAEAQYEQYNTARIKQSDTLEADFDRVIKQLPAASRRKSKSKGKA